MLSDIMWWFFCILVIWK